MSLTVHQFPCLEDNYGYLVRDDPTGRVACVDTPDAAAVIDQLRALNWDLDIILNTHWHGDHIGGNDQLRKLTGAIVFAPEEVSARTPVDHIIRPDEHVELGSTSFAVIDTGGHTAQHVSYHDPASGTAFVGDTLFAMGCGRIFEGSVDQMWTSLMRLAALPPETLIYCAHEYTEANSRFAVAHDPSPEVRERYLQVLKDRLKGKWTVPTTIGRELATNPFLRAPKLHPELSPSEAFGLLRARKDKFVG